MLTKEEIRKELPEDIKDVAFWYVNDLEAYLPEDESEDYLLSDELAKVMKKLDPEALGFLCVNSCLLFQDLWLLNCDYPIERDIEQLVSWLQTNVKPKELEKIKRPKQPTKNGREIVDCRICGLKEISEAVSKATEYLESKNFRDAGEVLFACYCADSEGAILPYEGSYEEWVVKEALVVSFKKQLLRP